MFLYLALFFSGILLLVANAAARWAHNPTRVVVGAGVLLTLVSCIFGILAIPLLTILFCLILQLPRSRFLPLSIVSFVVVFAVLSVPGIISEMKSAKWRERFPIESIEDRLPLQTIDQDRPASTFNEPRLAKIEEFVEMEFRLVERRAWELKYLHERAVSRFVNSSGFGVGRMNNRWINEKRLEYPRDARLIPSPLTPPLKLSSIDQPQLTTEVDQPSIDSLHQASIVDFVNFEGWGYFKDHHHVTGFQSHHFSKVPESPGKLKVTSIELIGWLHGEPKAYVSENLPSMSELLDAPTRPLDAFEEDALAKLRNGEDIVTKSERNGLRLFGSIRSAKQCINCHGGQRGDLLGAFSYQLISE